MALKWSEPQTPPIVWDFSALAGIRHSVGLGIGRRFFAAPPSPPSLRHFGDGAKGAGGLEVALRAALQHNGGVWLGWSGKVGARDRLRTRSVKHKNVEYVVTDLTKHDYQEYYNGFANRVLWPILHYRLDLAEFARRDLSGYFRVNDHFATEPREVLQDDDLIWVHDYHLIP